MGEMYTNEAILSFSLFLGDVNFSKQHSAHPELQNYSNFFSHFSTCTTQNCISFSSTTYLNMLMFKDTNTALTIRFVAILN